MLIRTSNAIESMFATVRHRTRPTKGYDSRTLAIMMVFKLAFEAEKKTRRLTGYQLTTKVIEGVRFTYEKTTREQSSLT